MGFKNRSVVLLARPVATARLRWWPRQETGYCWVTVYENGWSLGSDTRKCMPLARVARVQESFLDEYEELRGMKQRSGTSKWEWKTVSTP